MKLSKQRLKEIIKEEIYEEERAEGALGHTAESLAQMLQRKYGDETAIKLLTYALDIVQPGLYQPSDVEREEFMQEPYPGSRKRMSGKIDFNPET